MDYFSENFISKIINEIDLIVSRNIIKITLLKIEIGQFYLFGEIDIQRIAMVMIIFALKKNYYLFNKHCYYIH